MAGFEVITYGRFWVIAEDGEPFFNLYCHVGGKGIISYCALFVPLFLFAKHS